MLKVSTKSSCSAQHVLLHSESLPAFSLKFAIQQYHVVSFSSLASLAELEVTASLFLHALVLPVYGFVHLVQPACHYCHWRKHRVVLLTCPAHWCFLAAVADRARMAIETGAAAASHYIETAGDKLEQRYSGAENPRQLDPKTKARYVGLMCCVWSEADATVLHSGSRGHGGICAACVSSSSQLLAAELLDAPRVGQTTTGM